ncbi:MAG: Radical domain protein [Verrucomicrobiales bacterium]|nr:Radical domain protein [Verrucomicrobiales bacterium]
METLAFRPHSRTLLKNTTSRCTVCHMPCPAEVWKEGFPARVYLNRTCPLHGEQSYLISSDARFYWLAKGKESNSCCGSGSCVSADGSTEGTLGRNAEGAETLEKLSTCLALIEIVEHCNLACPTCYADSPEEKSTSSEFIPLEDLKNRIQGVIDRKGNIEILQLSGGEPTLHPELFELLTWLKGHPAIDYILLNTNGVLLATRPGFAQQLGDLMRTKLQLYLQFDGVQEEGQKTLRGLDLRNMRRRTIEACEKAGILVTLAMTVIPENLAHLWDAIEFGLNQKNVQGITFQPCFTSGRTTEKSPAKRLNTADIILGSVAQSKGQLQFSDFTPLPCGDPNCATISYLLRYEGKVHSISEFLNLQNLQGFLKDKIHYTLEDLVKCGCDSEPLGDLLKKLERSSSVAFRIMIKPFMDAASWDEDRIDRCCTHVIRKDGKLDSFCRYYSGFDGVTR